MPFGLLLRLLRPMRPTCSGAAVISHRSARRSSSSTRQTWDLKLISMLTPRRNLSGPYVKELQ